MCVLIVEDDALVAWALTECLEGAGHEVLGPAATAAEALALCAGAAGPPELAVLDIDLRDGDGNGVDVARALMARWGVPSIFASGQAEEARRATDVALGRIGKPYAPEAVLRCVEAEREVLEGRTPRLLPAGFELFSAAE
jgi:two-component system, response regulator PdtaR